MRHSCLLLLPLLLAGCGVPDGRMTVHRVRGSVKVDGRPASGMDVVLYPDTPLADKNADYPRAAVGEDGSFAITTYDEGDGAPAGSYKVSILQGGDSSSESIGARKPKKTGLERYKDPATSGLTATVKEGPNDLPAFELTSRQTK